MKNSILLAGLLALAPIASVSAAEAPSRDVIAVSYALGNVTEDALVYAITLAAKPELKNTVAGYALRDLIEATERLERDANRLALLLSGSTASDADILALYDKIGLQYAEVSDLAEDAVLRVSIAGKTTESFRLKSAYSKIRSRLAYLDVYLAGH